MPYSKSHKKVTRQRILDEAYRLFIANGYEATTIKQIMEASKLTHGAFYGHFASKKELFRQAVLKNNKNAHIASEAVLCEERQSSPPQQVQTNPSPKNHLNQQGLNFSSQFFRDDSVKNDPTLQSAYTKVFKSLCEKAFDNKGSNNKDSVFPMAAMLVGAETIAQSVDDLEMRTSLLSICKRQAELLAQGRYLATRNSYFWELN